MRVTHRMRIVIDLQGAQSESRFRGIGRFTMSLTRSILRANRQHEIFLLLNGLQAESIDSIRAELGNLLDESHFKVWYAPDPSTTRLVEKSRHKEIAAEIRKHVLQSLAPDVILVSSLFEGYADNAVTDMKEISRIVPTLVVLYDLIPLVNHTEYLQPYPDYAHFYLDRVEDLKRAAAWLAISRHTASEGITQLGLDADRMVLISAACDPIFRKIDFAPGDARALLGRLGIGKPFILYAGGVDQRKNVPRLLEAYAGLDPALRAAFQLVLAGRTYPHDRERLQVQAGLLGISEDELIFTGYVADSDLCALYNLCEVFVFPSWHEGFGLPALEAMSCGAAVIACNLTSIPEVVNREDALFDPFDIDDMRKKLHRALTDDQFREALAAHGLRQASAFSWDRTGLAALHALETYANRNPDRQVPPPSEEQLIEGICRKLKQTGTIEKAYLLGLAQALALNREPRPPRQLLVDISELVQKDARTGIQRVTRSILLELLESPPQGYAVRPVYAIQTDPGYRYAGVVERHVFTNALDNDNAIEINAGDIFIGLDLQHHVAIAQKEYLQFMRRHGVKVYFVVYDLLPLLMPNRFNPGAEERHRKWLSVLTCFDGALCISRSVANELEDWLRANPRKDPGSFKTGCFHLGADIENSSPTWGMPDDAPKILHGIADSPSFLMVGTVEPRKGHAQALAAFERLWAAGHELNLVIVGKTGWMVDALTNRIRSHPELGKRLFWLDGISDEYLEAVYARATCLIAASEGEGFGLPLIEAARHKLPVIARDIPVFREVAGDHAWFFRGANAEDLEESIRCWLQAHSRGNSPRSEYMTRLTWAQSARQLLDNVIPPTAAERDAATRR